MASTDIHISELTHRIELRVRGLRGWGVRLWIAAQLFRLGAWIAGVGIIMEQGDADGSS